MGKIKISKPRKKKVVKEDLKLSDNEDIYDDIDKYHINNEKNINIDQDLSQEENDTINESLFPIESSENEDDENELLRKDFNKVLEEGDSDKDEESESEEITRDNWGTSKSIYYNSDSASLKADQKRGLKGPKLSKIEKELEQKELLRMEEEEALILQKQMMEELKDEDFGLDFINEMAQKFNDTNSAADTDLSSKDFADNISNQNTTYLPRDLSNMNNKEKILLLKKESPEFLPWTKEALQFFKLLSSVLHPVLRCYYIYKASTDYGNVCKTSAADQDIATLESLFSNINPQIIKYLSLKRHLVSLYLVNFTYYLYHKSLSPKTASDTPQLNVYTHPVMIRLRSYKKLIETLDKKIDSSNPTLQDDIQNLATSLPSSITKNPRIDVKVHDKSAKVTIDDVSANILGYHPSQYHKVLDLSESLRPTSLKTISSPGPTSIQNREPFKLNKGKDSYFNTKNQRKQAKSVKFKEENRTTDIYNSFPAEVDMDGKRPINYEMAKNKGLTPKRKKEYKNPRVKHKIRYRKALIKRKSQVRIPKREINKYAGELTGIKIGLKRSIKIR
ncbi:unnamed protein product [Gordionus sp. m RMFG-2023]|uniref:something about silencing protein 10-like n=1 Tax=Gordionus sp. m RMFG-2023 TaxID=3053472 RepID=UPI0030E2711F